MICKTCEDAAGSGPLAAAGGRALAGQKAAGRGRLGVLLRCAAAALALLLAAGCAGTPGSAASTAASAPASSSEPDVGPVDPDDAAELLACIDQASALVAQTQRELASMDKRLDDGVSKYTIRATLLEKLVRSLEELKAQADALESLDGNLKSAKNEYFTMLCDAYAANGEVWTFFADYSAFCETWLDQRPAAGDHPNAKEYYNVLTEWYKGAWAAYKAIDSCPPCLRTRWIQYGENLALHESINYKFYQAGAYNDHLRYASAQNMLNRFSTLDESQFDEFVTCLDGEMAHIQWQTGLAASLAREMHSYLELDEEEREGYTFQYVRPGRLRMQFDAVETIYPSLYNSYDAFLVLKVGCASGTHRILVEAEIPGFTQSYRQTFTVDAAYTEIYIKPPALTGELSLNSAKSAQIRLTVSEMDGTLLEARSFPVTLKSRYDFEWYSDEYGVVTKDNILCFLTPESEAIARLKRQAIEEISAITDGQMESFVGYQGNRWENNYVGTYLQAAGVMRALYESGVRYNMDTFSISGSNQHILFPENVLAQRSGLCIETSLTVASALQSAGMHAFLIFPPGHAQVAVEVWNGRGNDTRGTGQYLLIETTSLSSGSNNRDIFKAGMEKLMDYKGPSGCIRYLSPESWEKYITSNTYVIDCNDSGVLGLTPFFN